MNTQRHKKTTEIKVIKILLIAVTLSVLAGCTSTKYVVPNLTTESYDSVRSPSIIAIDGTKIANKSATARPGLVELTVFYGDAFLESLKSKMSCHYSEVYVFKTNSELKKYDYIVSVTNEMLSMCGGVSCGITSNTFVNLIDKNNIKHIAEHNLVDNFVWEEPGSAKFLGFITGLTLLVVAPVTIPIGLSIEGEELKDQFSASNDRITSKIVEVVSAKTKDGGMKVSATGPVVERLETLKGIFDKGLIAKDDYEKRRKEILEGI
jgi:hypothetical protein